MFRRLPEDDDMFSRLPEDVVDLIISFLSLRDVATMSLVSKSWSYRWKICRNLNFDLHFLFPDEETSSGTMSRQKQHRYANWVNQILASHQGERIELFRIWSQLPKSSACADVDRWIKFALQKQASNIIIIDMPSYENGRFLLNYSIPQWLCLKDTPFLKHLTLSNICLGPFEIRSPNHLTSLTLTNVFVSETWVNDMLQNCIHLRRLALLHCPSLSITKLVVPSHLKLQHLYLSSGLRYLRKVEFEGGSNLQSFECPSNIIKGLNFDKLRNLRKLSLLDSASSSFDTLDYVVTHLPHDLPCLEHFHLSVVRIHHPGKVYSQANMRAFSQLRFLSLSGLHLSETPLTKYVGFLLKISPFLHTLELRGTFMPASNEQQIIESCLDNETHQKLKVVRIYGYEHCQTAVDLVEYLLQNCVNLDTLQIDRRQQSYMGEGIWSYEAKQEFKSSQEVISEWFQKHIPSSAKLVVL